MVGKVFLREKTSFMEYALDCGQHIQKEVEDR